MKKIVMPEPCSEDWSKMTPTEKGAFCDKCAIDVYDFTSKSNEEIRATIKMNAGKRTCGHISRTQLELINSDYHLWENQTINTFKSKFLNACLMVFGMALFTGFDYIIPEPEHDVGDIGYPEDVGRIEEVVDGGMMYDEGDTLECDIIDGELEIESGQMEFSEDEIEEHKVGTFIQEDE
ncbi:MAG: hypothetical protein MK078_09835 [Crocinitomicaceae bacterium]|nr:hypothetical protein [Crocinitomicaceae bacterium]